MPNAPIKVHTTKRIMTAAYGIYRQKKTIPMAFAASRARNPNMLQRSGRLREEQGDES
jgi:hypothetical protein